MREIDFWHKVLENINLKKKIILFFVADSHFASPGRKGFKMFLNEEGNSFGTIGGGIMEFNLINEFSKRIIIDENVAEIRKLVHNPNSELEKSGLICGGNQTVIIKSFTNQDLPTIREIIECFQNQKSAILRIERNDVILVKSKSNSENYLLFTETKNWIYEENIGILDTIYIVGGGHVGFEISKIMNALGFFVVMLDERENLEIIQNNNFVDKKIFCKFSEVGRFISEGERSYIVVVSPTFENDLVSIISVINQNYKYLGSMGSEEKIAKIIRKLRENGISENKITKIHSPVGLQISAQTPSEIAVSVAAEIISIKHK